MKLLLLSLLIVCFGAEQQPSAALKPIQSADERVAKLKTSLQSDNPLRLALENGYRGDGPHRAWMDTMKRLGVKHASFIVGFVWNDGVKSLKVSNITYLQDYYRYDTELKDPKLLRQFRDEGLETQLSDEITLRAKENVRHLILEDVPRSAGGVRPHQARGTLYLNLLDDEALPILDGMPQVDW
jgi:hypothetical protein